MSIRSRSGYGLRGDLGAAYPIATVAAALCPHLVGCYRIRRPARSKSARSALSSSTRREESRCLQQSNSDRRNRQGQGWLPGICSSDDELGVRRPCVHGPSWRLPQFGYGHRIFPRRWANLGTSCYVRPSTRRRGSVQGNTEHRRQNRRRAQDRSVTGDVEPTVQKRC